MKYLLFILFLFVQVLSAQTYQDLSMYKGDYTILSFSWSRDVTADSVYFVVKADRQDSTDGVIRRRNTAGGGDDTEVEIIGTTILVKLLVGNTEGLTAATYVYDLGADSTTLFTGYLKIIDEVTGSADGVPTRTPYYTVAIDTPNVANTFIVGQDSDNIWYRKTVAQTQTILGIDTLSGGLIVDLDSLYTYWVNKHEAQTITAQKNFRGRVEFGSDTSVVITDRITVNDSNQIVFKIDNQRGLGNMNIATYTHNFDDIEPDQTLTIGYNNTGSGRENASLAAFYWSIESEFDGWFEPHWEFHTYGGTIRKPISLRLHKTLGLTYGDFNFHKMRIKNPDNNADYITFGQDDPSFGKSIILYDTIGLIMDVNSIQWLLQKNSYGAYACLTYLDSLDQIVVSPTAGYKIKLGNNLIGDISWRNNANDADITIEPDSTDWVNFDNDAGINVQNIKIRGLQADTTGTEVGDLYVHPSTGVVHYNLGDNLLTNGDFSNWGGIGKKHIPDDWTFSYLDTLVSYVEESPAGQLHFVTDGSVVDQLVSNETQEVGEVYGYSFSVTQIVDSFNVYMPGWNVVVTQTGYYSGERISLAVNPMATIVPNSNGFPAEITIDNYKIWKKYGAKQTNYETHESEINILTPTTSDSIGIQRFETAGFVDSIFIYDILDSVAVQLFYRLDGSDTPMITSVDTLTTDTTITINVSNIPAGARVYMYPVYLGDSEAYIRSELYWRD